MRRIFFGCLSIIGLIAVLFMAGTLVLVVWGVQEVRQDLGHAGKSVPDRAVLILDLNGSVAERSSPFAPADPGAKEPPSLRPITPALDRAAGDSRIVALFADLSGTSLPL